MEGVKYYAFNKTLGSIEIWMETTYLINNYLKLLKVITTSHLHRRILMILR